VIWNEEMIRLILRYPYDSYFKKLQSNVQEGMITVRDKTGLPKTSSMQLGGKKGIKINKLQLLMCEIKMA
jgi:hypothetical protein